MAKERIEHEGRVIAVDKDYISVEIVNKSACAACHAKGVCGASDEAVKVVEVAQDITTLTEDYQVGETVNVVMSSAMGTQAIWLAYVVPLLVLMLSILVFSLCGAGEVLMGLGSLGAVALYYLGVFFYRKKISKIFIFSIEKQPK
ncbi:MAG: SoxR reducing system RseC family protein [Bacteroidales bacterium]|jgi:sigma-E factor negative regulatory protein RseC|nr:SoxR reducing system RseC family protein [Bacteroidales bacterium]MBQ1637451.1 SoxR reducing system RseC family protein [Bacteroidales bacterium]MBQ1754611.1 SoxR reducing system RseC family protein [Bacteroidales bacterium]MBQ1831418.1 SoxR reducing system RseC family protein [Bacteroidales bacterium]MBQ2148955.1 SoxR reducing system RseC family protein [Bacteroidales bacterium]